MPTWLAVVLVVMLVVGASGLSAWLASSRLRDERDRLALEAAQARKRAQAARREVSDALIDLRTTTTEIPEELADAIATADDPELRAAALRIIRGEG